MYIIELSDYTLCSIGMGNGLKGLYFAISRGDAFSIHADSSDDAHLFLKALATLVYPEFGTYRFMGEKISFSDYRNLLVCKKKIGYIAADSAMLSNRTIRENLLLMRRYFENSFLLNLDNEILSLCRIFDIKDQLDLRPADLHPVDLRIAITIREFSKSPDLLLIERPEDFIEHTKFNLFVKIFKKILLSRVPVVFVSYSRDFVAEFSNKKILITNGGLTTVSN